MKIYVLCGEDQGLISIVRMLEVSVELEDGISDAELEDAIWKALCDKEYNTCDSGWQNEVKENVSKIANCDVKDIEIN